MKKLFIVALSMMIFVPQAKAAASLECYLRISCDGQLLANEGRGTTAEHGFAQQIGDQKKCVLSENDKTYCNEICTSKNKRLTDCSTHYVPQPRQISGGNP